METYTTYEGDMVDQICFVHYGFIDGALEAVYAVNPDLRTSPAVLDGGITVFLPELSTNTKARIRRIFD